MRLFGYLWIDSATLLATVFFTYYLGQASGFARGVLHQIKKGDAS